MVAVGEHCRYCGRYHRYLVPRQHPSPQGSPRAPRVEATFQRSCSCTYRLVKCRARQYTTPKLYLHILPRNTRMQRSLAFTVYFIHGVQLMHGLRISVRYKHGSKRQWNHTAAEVLQRLRFTVHSFLKKTKKQKKDQTPRRNPTKNRRLHCRTTHCSFLPDSRNQYTITSHDHKQSKR